MKLFIRLFTAFGLGIVLFILAPPVSAQTKAPAPQITFDSFTGVYHLSRDSRGLSLLTTEETILADFPGNGSFYGITRSIPKEFQNHSVNVKVLNVSDAAGNIVPYKTTTDSSNNLVVTTGDPGITLYGSQTIKIRYQTSGVINLNKKSDEFLLNINGRGWDQQFAKVNSTLYIPASSGAKLKTGPICYLALAQSKNNNCQINTKKASQETVITAKAENLAAHQSLILKLEFRSSTFTNKHAVSSKTLSLVALLLLILGSVFWRLYEKEKNLN
jgi:hypothetical protein